MDTPESASATTSLTMLMQQTALGIAEAQTALDAYSQAQLSERDPDSSLPVLAFGFADVEVDLQFAISTVRVAGVQRLGVLPLSPLGQGFFRTATFSSRLRARIAPLNQLFPQHPKENDDA